MLAVPIAHAQRVKDLTMVQGVRNNQLVGYGLVVGLDGTGDQTTQTPFTTQSLLQHAQPARRHAAAGDSICSSRTSRR